MAKIGSFSVIALFACLVAVNAVSTPFVDEEGNRCPMDCSMSRDIDFVCGSNGQTYVNPDVLKCHNKCLKSGVITQKHAGRCSGSQLLRKAPDSECPCVSTLEYVPVCGTDGKTYSNRSTLKCENECKRKNIKVKRSGKCRARTSKKVRGSDC